MTESVETVACAKCGSEILIAPPEDDPKDKWICGTCNKQGIALSKDD